MKTLKLKLLLFLFISALFVLGTSAQTYTLKKGVFGNGGGSTKSTNFKLNGTLGQSVIGINANSWNRIHSGFWHPNSGPPTYSVDNKLSQGNSNSENLFSVYPNPFHSTLNLRINLKEQSRVQLKIYDNTGKLIQVVNDKELPGQQHNFEFNSGDLPNGIYYCRLQSNKTLITKKISLVR